MLTPKGFHKSEKISCITVGHEIPIGAISRFYLHDLLINLVTFYVCC